MKYNAPYLFELISKIGIEKSLLEINIEDVEDINLKIILRTINHSHEALISHLRNNN